MNRIEGIANSPEESTQLNFDMCLRDFKTKKAFTQ